MHTPRDLLRRALSGLEPAGSQIAEGGRDSGPPLHDTAAQGWSIELETQWDDRVGADGVRRVLAYRYYVDHVGLGRRDALPMYLDALRSAGLGASMAPLHRGSAKQVVWLDGRYDGEGRRLPDQG